MGAAEEVLAAASGGAPAVLEPPHPPRATAVASTSADTPADRRDAGDAMMDMYLDPRGSMPAGREARPSEEVTPVRRLSAVQPRAFVATSLARARMTRGRVSR
jgi:hypothetical protein